MPDADGVTKRDHLLNVIEQAPEDSDMYNSAIMELEEGPEIPSCIEHVWEWFWQIHSGRTSNMSGPNPISWADLLAWTFVTGIQVRPIEFEIIKEIDLAYLKYIAEKQDKKRKLQDRKPNQKGTKNG